MKKFLLLATLAAVLTAATGCVSHHHHHHGARPSKHDGYRYRQHHHHRGFSQNSYYVIPGQAPISHPGHPHGR